MSDAESRDVQGYLLAIIERDREQERADKAEQERQHLFANAFEYLKENGPVYTNTNNGPSYVLYAESGRIIIKEAQHLFGRNE